MKLKVMTYNIKEGFCDKNKKGNYKLNKNRQKFGQEVVKFENPDILIITEACFITKNFKIKQNYKKIFGYKYEALGSDVHKKIDWGICILSKYPIVKSHDYTIKYSRFVRTLIKVKNKIIMVDGIHPEPSHKEHLRMQWFKNVLRDKKNPYILGGDFNAFSPKDKYDKRKLIKGFKEYAKKGDKSNTKKIVEEILTGKTINFLLNQKLIDTFKAKNKKWDYSYHTSLSKNKYDYSRIDYIFCSQDIKVKDAGIIKNELTEKASDHYPIYAELEI